ncbi:MAG: four-helix bundle copper-binding protein [Beijerinckiaceae bacterium]
MGGNALQEVIRYVALCIRICRDCADVSDELANFRKPAVDSRRPCTTCHQLQLFIEIEDGTERKFLIHRAGRNFKTALLVEIERQCARLGRVGLGP